MDRMGTAFLLLFIFGVSKVFGSNFEMSKFVGNPDVSISNGTAIKSSTLKNASSIYCSTKCKSYSSCVAFVMDTVANTCSFYEKFYSFIYNATQITYLESVTPFTLLQGSTAFYDADGTLYMFNTIVTQTWQQSYDLCYTALGFITLQPKKIYQLKIMSAQQSTFPGTYALGLRRNVTTGTIFFDDRTPYSSTEVSSYETPRVNENGNIFQFFQSHYDDWFANVPFVTTPICRADPFNVTGDLTHA